MDPKGPIREPLGFHLKFIVAANNHPKIPVGRLGSSGGRGVCVCEGLLPHLHALQREHAWGRILRYQAVLLLRVEQNVTKL